MPNYIDQDFKGVKIGVTPKKIIRWCKNISKPLGILDIINVRIKLSKQSNFDDDFWEYINDGHCAAITIKLPDGKLERLETVRFGDGNEFEKDFISNKLSAVGEATIHISKYYGGVPVEYSKIFFADIQNKEWGRYGWFTALIGGVVGGLVVGLVMLGVQYMTGIY